MHRVRLVPLAALSLCASLAWGCTPGLDDPERFSGACRAGTSVEALLAQRCSGATCHGGGSGSLGGDLDLTSDGVLASLVGKTAATCAATLVVPASPDDSFLLQKVGSSPTCGSRMPLGGTALSPGEIACLREWIASAADAGASDAALDAEEGASDAASDRDAGEPDASTADAADDADASPTDAESDAADDVDASADDARGDSDEADASALDAPGDVDASLDGAAE